MTRIASAHNPRLKSLRRLRRRVERDRSGTFLAEGEDLIAAARACGRPALAGFRLAGSAAGGEGFHEVEASALSAVSTLGSGSRVIAVYEQRWSKPSGPLCVYLHEVGDPGNVGTVLRSAQAFGASCVALGPGCADPHSPKAVRASMGSIFAVSLARVADADELPGERIALLAGAQAGVPPLAALRAQEQTDPPAARTLLVGAERDGLPCEVVARCERTARIPVAVQSLNAAMAATVALYELTRAPAPAPGSSRVRAT
jgi:RNA methyltransferase, TrmH family